MTEITRLLHSVLAGDASAREARCVDTRSAGRRALTLAAEVVEQLPAGEEDT